MEKTIGQLSELSEVIDKLEEINRVIDIRIEYHTYKSEFTVKGGNITVTAPKVITAMKMFVSAYENFNKPKLDKLIEEVTQAKDDMFESIANLAKPEYLRKGNN